MTIIKKNMTANFAGSVWQALMGLFSSLFIFNSWELNLMV